MTARETFLKAALLAGCSLDVIRRVNLTAENVFDIRYAVVFPASAVRLCQIVRRILRDAGDRRAH